MPETLRPDLCVIGAGTGGLVVAAGAAQMGASVVLVEEALMGGDCLNYGCVPSKSLIAAARVAETMRRAAPFGIAACEPQIDFEAVIGHVHEVIARIAPHDSVERFEGLGVRVIRATGRFIDPRTVLAGDLRITARRFVVATGSSPAVPAIPGIEDIPYLTNETVFENRERPRHLLVLGGGPIGAELAQAHRRLGSAVTLIEPVRLLGKDDPELVEVIRARLRAEGIALREGASAKAVEQTPDGIAVVAVADGREERIEASHLLVAAGRRPKVEGLGLETAGIRFDKRGIETDARLRTSNRRVYAVGDVAGRLQFTHVAAHHAGVVIRNALFRIPAKVDERAVPWVTYTDPELAHVGLGEAAAREAGYDPTILRFAVTENDRAQTERATDGLIKVVASGRGRVLGASIAAERAGELILSWVLAVREGISLRSLASVIAPYPTLSEISRSAAGSFYTPKLFSRKTRGLVRFLARFG